jgi:hypothetical protein
MSNTNSNTSYSNELVAGLAPALPLSEMGITYQTTTRKLSAMLVKEFNSTYNLPELDAIIITPKLAKNSIGASEIFVYAYFDTKDATGNIFYRGKGKNNYQNGNDGRISFANIEGVASEGTGPFGTSDFFKSVIKPFCKTNDKGNPIMNIKAVPGYKNIASIELDFNLLMCVVLGIKHEDSYDFDIMSVKPTAKDNDFFITVTKYIYSENVRKGKHSNVNYTNIERSQMSRINNGGGNNNRSY